MEDKIKGLIATFIRIPAEQISNNTVIDRTAVSSSIALHRMYAKLAEEGFVVPDYWNIKTVSTLLERINGNGHNTLAEVQDAPMNVYTIPVHGYAEGTAVGIDIENVAAMPRTNDFREDAFYKMNFSSAEIAYCILQPSPYASFAGLFAAKEAIVKANNANRNKLFNTIGINHDQEGKPTFPGFYISVSHTDDLAIAVALQTGNDLLAREKKEATVTPPSNRSTMKWWFILSFITSLIALFIALFK